MAIENRDRRARIGFGAANVAVGISVAGGVYRLLPARWWVVDSGAVVVAGLFLASGITLLRSLPVAEKLTRIAAGIILAAGLALVITIFATASWLSGVYGPVGSGGAIVFALVGALLLPYLIVLPAAELAWLGPREPQPTAALKPEPAPEPEADAEAEESKRPSGTKRKTQ